MRNSWLIPLAALTLAACQAREPQAPGRPGDQAAAPPAATAPVPPPALEAPQAAGPGCCACPPAKVEAACPPAAKAPVRRARAPRRAVRPAPQQVARLEQDEGRYERYERYSERTGADDGGGVRVFEDRSYEESSRSREGYLDDGADCCAASAAAAGRDANGFLNWPGKVPAIP